MADETPICKKCGTPKKIMKGAKRNQHFIGCPKCSPSASPEPGRTTSPPAPEVKPPKKPEAVETKKKTFWW